MTASDSESIARSVRAVIRDELEPLKLSQQRTADAVLELRSDVQKVETQLHGNGRPGLCERMALVERAVKSFPPPPARGDMPSIADVFEVQQRETTKRWKIAVGAIVTLLIGSGAGWGLTKATAPAAQAAPASATPTR